MKRKFLTAVLSLSMCFTSFTAFAAEDTSAEELLKKQSEFSQNAESMSMDMDMNFDFDFLMSNTSEDGTPQDFGMTMKMSSDMLVEMLMEPMKVAVSGTMELETNTPGEEKETVDMLSYCTASEDGTTMDVYSQDPNGEWIHTQMDMAETMNQFGVSSLNELMVMEPDLSMYGDVSDWSVNESENEYEVSGQMKLSDMSETMMPVIMESLGASGDETTETMVTTVVDTILDCFVINLSYSLDKETCAVKSMHMDFNDSDLTPLTDLIKSALALSGDTEAVDNMDLTIALNDFTIDATCQYDTVDEITIPEEALNSEVFDVNDAISDAENELEQGVESELAE